MRERAPEVESAEEPPPATDDGGEPEEPIEQTVGRVRALVRRALLAAGVDGVGFETQFDAQTQAIRLIGTAWKPDALAGIRRDLAELPWRTQGDLLVGFLRDGEDAVRLRACLLLDDWCADHQKEWWESGRLKAVLAGLAIRGPHRDAVLWLVSRRGVMPDVRAFAARAVMKQRSEAVRVVLAKLGQHGLIGLLQQADLRIVRPLIAQHGWTLDAQHANAIQARVNDARTPPEVAAAGFELYLQVPDVDLTRVRYYWLRRSRITDLERTFELRHRLGLKAHMMAPLVLRQIREAASDDEVPGALIVEKGAAFLDRLIALLEQDVRVHHTRRGRALEALYRLGEPGRESLRRLSNDHRVEVSTGAKAMLKRGRPGR